MSTKSKDIRVTPKRAAELREEIARLEGRLETEVAELRRRLDERDNGRDALARSIAAACIHTLKHPTPIEGDPAP